MTRMIKSLLGRKEQEPTPEELEALRLASAALQSRVNSMLRQGLLARAA
jgi:hypothetical protein